MKSSAQSSLFALAESLRRGGAARAEASPNSKSRLSGSLLRRLILRYSRATEHRPACVSLTLVNFQIQGNLDLESCGLEGAPLMGLELIGCTILGVLNVRYAYLKALSFEGTKEKWGEVSSIEARGVTVVDLFVLSRIRMTGARILDVAESRLRGGAKLTLITGTSVTKEGLAYFSVARSVIGSDMHVLGMHVTAKGRIAFDGEELKLAGSLYIGSFDPEANRSTSRTYLAGELNLQGAVIGGELSFKGVKLLGASRAESPGRQRSGSAREGTEERPAFAIRAEEMTVGGDISFTESNRHRKQVCSIGGQIDFTGATVGGDLLVCGTFRVSSNRIRAFRAARIKIKGDLRYGYVPFQDKSENCSRHCHVHGECDFSGAEIGGKAVFSGSTHEITRGYYRSGIQRLQKQAIHLKGATIGSELWFQSGLKCLCLVEGVTLTGAKMGGRLLVHGARIIAPCPQMQKNVLSSNGLTESDLQEHSPWRFKALSANGSTISGGILMTVRQDLEEQSSVVPTRVEGGIRLRNAVVDGPVEFQGVDIIADDSGYALWASNTQFGSDVLIVPQTQKKHKTSQPVIRGELCFQGAQVKGRLWVQGVDLRGSHKNGVALDCFTAKVERSVTLGSFCPERVHRPGEAALRCDVVGLVSLVQLRAQSVTIGANPITRVDPNYDMLSVTGCILMRDCRLQSTVFIANTKLRPIEVLSENDKDLKSLRSRMLAQRCEWGIYRKYCALHANYAVLGTRLFVRLLDGSCGLVSLYAAKTWTIGGLTGSTKESWYKRILNKRGQWSLYKQTKWLLKASWRGLLRRLDYFLNISPSKGGRSGRNPQRESWGPSVHSIYAWEQGRPRPSSSAEHDVLLHLDDFTYDRTNDSEEEWVRYRWSFWRLCFWILGRPSPRKLEARCEWLTRIVENPGAQEPVVVSAHRQLAKVYREMGRIRLSYYYTRERRWLQIRFGRMSSLQRIIDCAYSALFGFGYSPARALVTLIMLYFAGLGFVIASLCTPVDCINPNAKTCSPAWTYVAPLVAVDRPALLDNVGVEGACDSTRQVCVPALHILTFGFGIASDSNSTSAMKQCRGALCEPDKLQLASAFHLPVSPFDYWNVAAEAGKLILPLPHLTSTTNLTLHNEAPVWLRVWLMFLSIGSWSLFPLAIATFTGVLRENP